MTKYRKGDVATIEVIVTSSVNETQVCVKPVDGYSDIYVKPHELTMLRPKIEVGDRISWRISDGDEDAFEGRVLSIANDHLWVDIGAGNFATVWVGKATRLDPETADSAEAA